MGFQELKNSQLYESQTTLMIFSNTYINQILIKVLYR